MSDVEPRKHAGRVAVPRHIPEMVVPISIDDVRGFVRDALKGTSIANPLTSAVSGWAFFKPYVRFTPVDATHSRIEIDVVGQVRGAETLLFQQRRAEIDRFFVAIQDQLDRLEHWRALPNGDATLIDPSKAVNQRAKRHSPRHRNVLGEPDQAAIGALENGKTPPGDADDPGF